MQWFVRPKKKQKVCIALSGGVDSSVAAYMLQKEGYEVMAAFIKVWQPDFLPCSQDEDRLAAKRVAAALGIPFYVVDLAKEYKEGIVEYMVDSYTQGETPNPDVTCNKVIKFGALWQWAKGHGCEFIATGHHAQVRVFCPCKNNNLTSEPQKFTTSFCYVSQTPQGCFHFLIALLKKIWSYRALKFPQQACCSCSPRYELLRGADPAKDQAYFLWELTNEDLAHILLPIGHMQKSDVRTLAARARIPSASRKDSQGLCFLGTLSMSDFLEHLTPSKKGLVKNERGEIVGVHQGAHLFTLGQRGGFTPHTKTTVPLYVVSTNTETNEIVLAPSLEPYMQDTYTLRSVVLRDTSLQLTHAEVRYHGEKIPVLSCELDKKNIAREAVYTIHLSKQVLVAPGQSCVLYAGDVCVGGGIVTTK